MNNKNIKLELVQQHNLINVFDLDVDYFKKRIGICFFEGIHYFPQSEAKTKKAVLWDVDETKKALKSLNQKTKLIPLEPEVAELLKRR